MWNAENVQQVKCGFIPHEYSAFYTFAIFRIPQYAFRILPVPGHFPAPQILTLNRYTNNRTLNMPKTLHTSDVVLKALAAAEASRTG